jgi:hypothetical protein
LITHAGVIRLRVESIDKATPWLECERKGAVKRMWVRGVAMIKALGGFLAAKYREFIGLQVFNVMWLDGPTAERRHRGNDNAFGTVRL